MDKKRALPERMWRTVIILLVLGAAAGAVDVEVHGALYGALVVDGEDGNLESATIPAPNVETFPPTEALTGDGDPAANFRYEGDVNLQAVFNERIAAHLNFTFDDRKQTPIYRYTLYQDNADVYHLTENRQPARVYGTLDEVNLEFKELFAGTNVWLGGYRMRYGEGGYYNALTRRLDPVSFVAYLDPFGARFRRPVGPVELTLDLGYARDNQPVAAVNARLKGFAITAATEGRTYDLKSLWESRFVGAAPKTWRYYYIQTGLYHAEPEAAPGDIGDAIHVGAEETWQNDWLQLYGVAAVHLFADAPELSENASGGMLIQLYPDAGVRIIPRLWFRAAALYEIWNANYDSAFGDGVKTDESLLVFAEPQYYIRDDLLVGVGGRYSQPSGNLEDYETTDAHEDVTLSVAALPHLRYTPIENITVDLTYAFTQWDYSYNLVDTPISEDRGQEIRLEIEAGF